MKKAAKKAAKKPEPCGTCGACPTCGRAPAPAVTPMPPVIIVQPVAPAPIGLPYPPPWRLPWRLPDGPIWIVEQPQWANPCPVTYSSSTAVMVDQPGVVSTNVAIAQDIGNGYRPIWGQGGVS